MTSRDTFAWSGDNVIVHRHLCTILASLSLALAVAVVFIAVRQRGSVWIPLGPLTLVPERYAMILYWRHREFFSADYWALSLTLGAFPVVWFLLMVRRRRNAQGFPVDQT